MAVVMPCTAVIQIRRSTTKLIWRSSLRTCSAKTGWNVVHQPREEDSAPDLVASRPGRKLVIEIKRASEGRRDRVIPLLSQAALEAAYFGSKLSYRFAFWKSGRRDP
jgi:hypothetical protein